MNRLQRETSVNGDARIRVTHAKREPVSRDLPLSRAHMVAAGRAQTRTVELPRKVRITSTAGICKSEQQHVIILDEIRACLNSVRITCGDPGTKKCARTCIAPNSMPATDGGLRGRDQFMQAATRTAEHS